MVAVVSNALSKVPYRDQEWPLVLGNCPLQANALLQKARHLEIVEGRIPVPIDHAKVDVVRIRRLGENAMQDIRRVMDGIDDVMRLSFEASVYPHRCGQDKSVEERGDFLARPVVIRDARRHRSSARVGIGQHCAVRNAR